MFTRSLYQTDDMQARHKLLNELASLVDQGIILETAVDRFLPLARPHGH